MAIDPAVVQAQPIDPSTPNGTSTPQATAQATVQQTTTATAPDKATAVKAVDQAVSASGIGQAIGADLAKTPTAVAGLVIAAIALLLVVSVIGFGYLLVQAVSDHNPQAQAYVSAIGDRILVVGAVVLGGLGLYAAPSPVSGKP